MFAGLSARPLQREGATGLRGDGTDCGKRGIRINGTRDSAQTYGTHSPPPKNIYAVPTRSLGFQPAQCNDLPGRSRKESNKKRRFHATSHFNISRGAFGKGEKISYLCVRKSGDAHRLRVPAFVPLKISNLPRQKVYIPERGDVHPGATAPIPVATKPIPVARKPIPVPTKRLSAP